MAYSPELAATSSAMSEGIKPNSSGLKEFDRLIEADPVLE